MLTPKQLKNYDFQAVGKNAYKSSDVDEFMDEITASYEQMFRENAELIKKLNLLADKISEYRNEENSIRDALLTAQRTKDSIINEARQQAESQVSSAAAEVEATKAAAEQEAANLLNSAKSEAAAIVAEARATAENTMETAKDTATKLVGKAQAIYDEQVGGIHEEVERELAYLNSVKKQSMEVRKRIMDACKMQLELLEFTPDFSDEVTYADLEEEYEEALEAEEEATEEEAEEELAPDTSDEEDDSDISDYLTDDDEDAYEPDIQVVTMDDVEVVDDEDDMEPDYEGYVSEDDLEEEEEEEEEEAPDYNEYLNPIPVEEEETKPTLGKPRQFTFFDNED